VNTRSGRHRGRTFALNSSPFSAKAIPENKLTKTDFYLDGLSGGPDSTKKRAEFAVRAGLPPTLTANALPRR
jgi:hypothetical protein